MFQVREADGGLYEHPTEKRVRFGTQMLPTAPGTVAADREELKELRDASAAEKARLSETDVENKI